MNLHPEFVKSINSFDLDEFPKPGDEDFEPKLITAITANFARQGRSVKVRIEDEMVYAQSEVAIELEATAELEILYYCGFFPAKIVS